MGHLFAALQPKGSDDLRLIQLSQDLQENLEDRFQFMDEQFFNEIDDYIAFDGGYHPDQNQMLQIQLTDEMAGLLAKIELGAIAQERYNPNEVYPDEIRALLWFYENGHQSRILVQNFTKAQAVSRRGILLTWGDRDTFTKLEPPTILVGDKIDGVIWEGRFQFKSFHIAKQMFDLREVYREATSEEVEQFIQLPVVEATDENFIGTLNATQRRLIFAVNRAETLVNLTVNEVANRAANANFELEVNNGRLVLPTGRELTRVLRFLDNGIYRSPINDELYVSNSHRRA